MDWTMARFRRRTLKRLAGYKVNRREPYDDVVNRILDVLKKKRIKI